MSKQLVCQGIEDIDVVANQIIDEIGANEILLFQGEMGAGKTTLIKAICRHLGSEDTSSSPSFSLINEYRAADGSSIYHMDLYRLEDIEQAYEIGIEDYLFSGSYCFIEWPDIIEPLLEGLDFVIVHVKVMEDGSRIIDLVNNMLE